MVTAASLIVLILKIDHPLFKNQTIQTDNYQHTNCFNLHCPGLNQKSSKYSPGMALNDGTLPRATYKNDYGDIIDCVDFDKQPAFDHPSFKNQSTQRTHTSYPNGEYMPRHTISKVALKTAICPTGTVAIRRTTKEDLVRLKSLSTFGGDYLAIANLLNYAPPSTVHYGVLLSDNGSYRGANALLPVYHLSGVGSDQYSGTSIMMFSGADGPLDKFNVISAGWLVHPALYGDGLTRLTIFWTTDGYQNTTCFNLHCPGFILKSSKYSPGVALDEGSLPLTIFMDNQTGDWCLSTSDGKTSEEIGCWPKSIFSSLDGGAEFIQWGGTVMSPLDMYSPPMGNGRFPVLRMFGACISQISTLDDGYKVQDPKGRRIADWPNCYRSSDFANRPKYGWSFYYGGPGGCLG